MAVLGAFVFVSSASAEIIPLNPVYTSSFNDAITGDNEYQDFDGNSRWFINAGADSYATDVYERPTSQTYTNSTVDSIIGGDFELNGAGMGSVFSSSVEYLAYLDIKNAQFGFDSQFMYFRMQLFGGGTHSEDGSVDLETFGSGTHYGVRLSADPNAHNGLFLRADGAAKDTWSPSLSAGEFNSLATQGFQDVDGDVGGPGGILTTAEGTDGFETQPILSDGVLRDDSDTAVLYSRISFADVDGAGFPDSGDMPFVEIAFDYASFNEIALTQILPADLQYLAFEANRGTQDPRNYLWNDEYTAGQAGSPYQQIDLQNVYELDTLTAGLAAVPAPSSLLLGVLGLAAVIGWSRKKAR